MRLVLLSGGSGKRLWPLSNDSRSKQYLKLFGKGNKMSMLQRMCAQLKETGLLENAVIVSSRGQLEILQNQLGSKLDIALEPDRRDTFPAALLAASYLVDRKGASEDEAVCFLPVDPHASSDYFELIKSLEDVLFNSKAQVALMGIKPTYNSAKYGYITKKENFGSYYKVKDFIEKPSEDNASLLIQNGAMWNSGVFCCKISFLTDFLKKYELPVSYEKLCEQYDRLPKISLDYKILESGPNMVAADYDGDWKDLGTWNTLTEEMSSNSIGKVIMDKSKNTSVINETDLPCIVLGAENMIVVASPDGFLVAEKHQSSFVKKYVENVNARPMYEERRWGTIKIIDISENTLTRKIKLYSGMNSSFHHHVKHKEIWTILDGKGEMVLGDKKMTVKMGDVIQVPENTDHALRAIEDMEFIEVQVGKNIEDDTTRTTLDWNKIMESYNYF